MPVAVAAASSLDGCVCRHRVRTRIALVRILERDSYFRLGTGHGDERNTDGCALVESCAKIGVAWAGCADGIDVGCGLLMDGQRVYRRVPDIIRGKNRATADG